MQLLSIKSNRQKYVDTLQQPPFLYYVVFAGVGIRCLDVHLNISAHVEVGDEQPCQARAETGSKDTTF